MVIRLESRRVRVYCNKANIHSPTHQSPKFPKFVGKEQAELERGTVPS